MTQMPAWSYTMIETFEQCPRRAYHKFILREKEPSSKAQDDGIAAHQALEDRVKKGTALPGKFAAYEPLAASIARAREGKIVYTELKMGLNRRMEATGFFGDSVWARGAVDVFLKGTDTAFLGDWKTGKIHEKELQVRIFAVFAFRHFPTVNKITACNLWLKDNKVGQPYIFTRENEDKYWADILPRVQKIEQACATGQWAEKPSPLCGWCPVKACQFNPNKGTS